MLSHKEYKDSTVKGLTPTSFSVLSTDAAV